MRNLRIVFFGSGPVAAASLASLAEHFNVEAVITKSVPAHHRGTVPVAETARGLTLPLLTADNRAELDQLLATHRFESKAGVIVDYGVIVSGDVIAAFPLGIVNSHFSLLPQWRGADPITFTILSGQPETGVSLMLIVEKLDEGPLLAQEKLAVPPSCTTPQLTDLLIAKSNAMLKAYLPQYLRGELKPYSQPSDVPATYSRKLTKEDGRLDWTKPAEVLEREIRAFAEWPKSYTELGGIDVIITKAHVVNNSTGTSGKLDLTDGLIVNCGRDRLAVDELKPAGKPNMSSEAFLVGYRQRLLT